MQRMHGTSRGLLKTGDLCGKCGEILLLSHKTGPVQQEIIIVGGESLGDPEAPCVDFALVVEWS